MNLDPLLDDLSSWFAQPRLRLNEHQACALRLDGEVRVQLHFNASADTVRLVAIVGQAHADGRLSLLSSLLMGNLQQALEGQPVFGFDRATSAVVITHAIGIGQRPAHVLASQIRHLAQLCRGARQALIADRAILA